MEEVVMRMVVDSLGAPQAEGGFRTAFGVGGCADSIRAVLVAGAYPDHGFTGREDSVASQAVQIVELIQAVDAKCMQESRRLPRAMRMAS
jgi:hypothetical protein